MIGLLGGTFDPIHFGHLRPALEVLESLQLDELRFLPAGVPPHRAPPAVSSEHRAAMVALAIAGTPRFRLDTRELERHGPSYTVDTLETLRAELGPAVPLVMLLGADAFAGLDRWHRWEHILQLAHVVVEHRPGADLRWELGGPQRQRFASDPEQLRAAPAGCLWVAEVTALAISATQIRDTLANGRSARFLLPDAVLDYIQEHRLYSAERSVSSPCPESIRQHRTTHQEDAQNS